MLNTFYVAGYRGRRRLHEDMALMRTVHPLDFIRVKTALAASVDRDPLKRPKDRLQAQGVQRLWDARHLVRKTEA